jgi:DNA transformation protein and related proteins
MSVTAGFLAFVLEQLDPIGPIVTKRMFGGVGVYAGDLFFALVSGDVLYLKGDDDTRGRREAAGSHPFQPPPGRPRGRGKMQYYSVPAAILEDDDKLIAWAKEAVSIARAQKAPPRPTTATPERRLSKRRSPR